MKTLNMRGPGETKEKLASELAELPERSAEAEVMGTECSRALEALRASEERFRSLVENTDDWVWELDANLIYTYASPGVKELLGYRPQEVVGKTPIDLMPPEEAKRIASQFQAHVESQEPIRRLVSTSLHKDGRLVVLETSGVPFFDADGRLCGYRGISRDISERKRLEKALKESKKELITIFDNVPLVIFIVDREYKVRKINRFSTEFAGRTVEEAIGLRVGEALGCLHHLDDPKGCGYGPSCPCTARLTMMDTILTGNTHHQVEVSLPFCLEGKEVELDFLISTASVILSGEEMVIVCIENITERKQAEEALRASDEKYRAIFDEARDGIVLTDAETGLMTDCNREFERQTGRAAAELRKMHIWALRPPDQVEAARQKFFDVRETGSGESSEMTLQRPSGEEIPVEFLATRVHVIRNRPYVQSAYRDITERKQAEEALRASDEKYRAIFDEARDGIVLTDAETGLIADCNPEFERQTGRAAAELRKMHFWELRPPDQVEAAREKFFDVREKGSGGSSKLGFLRPDGEETLIELVATTVEIGGKPYLQSVSRDVTGRLRMEEQLRQSRLLASLGEMTAGIAHEVNNPLSAILLFSELVAKAEAPAQVRKDIRVIRSEAKRASNIMKDLLTYSRKRGPVVRRMDLHRTLRKVIDMRRYRDQVRNIDIAVEMVDGPLRVLGNTAHLTQVFMNLIVNAEEAIENSTDKKIVVTTEKFGAWARISIADSGVGIREEHLTQVFLPFFSTKPIGKGTGLGLATCHGIVTAHGGLIRVENNHMGGATFIVEVPLAGGGLPPSRVPPKMLKVPILQPVG